MRIRIRIGKKTGSGSNFFPMRIQIRIHSSFWIQIQKEKGMRIRISIGKKALSGSNFFPMRNRIRIHSYFWIQDPDPHCLVHLSLALVQLALVQLALVRLSLALKKSDV